MKTKLSYFLSSKTVAVMFAFTLFLFGIFAWGMNEDTVYAADYTTLDDTTNEDFAVATYDATTASSYIGQTAPTVEGYLFAGWFNDAKCEEASVIKNAAGITGTECYAKFVPEDVLSIKVQVSKGDATTAKNMRFVSSVDTVSYLNVGFRMKYQDDNKNWTYKINQGTIVYERIDSATEGDEYEFSPKVIDTKSEYFITSTWKGENNTGVAPEDFNTNYYVRAYWTTFDGVRVYGPTRYVSVSDGVNKNIVNVSTKDAEQKFISEIPTISYTDSTGTSKEPSAITLYHDGTYAHMKIDLGTGVDRETALSSATLFAMSNTQGNDEVIYRNLYTTHKTNTTTANADSTWYSVYNTADSSKTEYVIATSADMYGLSALSASNTFSTAKIYLVSDVALNIGNATDSDWSVAAGETEYEWKPITAFAGKFDGQKHTISGISCNTDNTGTGLFGKINNATIENLNISNSFIKGKSSNNGTGVLAGCGYGTIKNVSVDATLVAGAIRRVAGILGRVNGATTISNCWNACNITSSTYETGGIIAAIAGQYNITIEHCLNTGDLVCSRDGNAYMGGIAGMGNAAAAGGTGKLVISDCMNAGKVYGTVVEKYMGAIVGNNGSSTSCVQVLNSCAAVQYAEDGTTVVGKTGTLIGYDKSGAVETGSVVVPLERVKGDGALLNTTLDLVRKDKTGGNWAARENKIPMLVQFLTSDDVVVDEADTTIYISTAAEFMEFATKVNKGTLVTNAYTKVVLKNDINLNEGWTAGATAPTNKWTPIKGFAGEFDGCGYTISGVYVASQASGQTGIGLFTQTNGAVIKDFKLTNSYFKAANGNGTGAIIGQGNGTIQDVYVNAIFDETVAVDAVGGFVGKADGDVTVSNCWNASDIYGKLYCGGILGNITNTGFNITIEHCLNTGSLNTTLTSNAYHGGFVGRANTAGGASGVLTITDSLNAGIVPSNGAVGGLAGQGATTSSAKTGIFTNSYTAIQYEEDGTTVIGKTNVLAGTNNAKVTHTKTAAVPCTNLYGVRAKVYTKLDFDTYWTTRTGDVPVLTKFKSPSDGVEVEDPTLFLLTNNAGTIRTAEQLISFAELMNTGVLDVNGDTVVTLANDINLNEGWDATSGTAAAVTWDAIVGYPGTFDGAGYTISGLYAAGQGTGKGIGLFTETKGATIKNLSITNSYFNVNTSNGSGVVIGLGNGKVQNVYTEAILVNTDAKGRMGGIVGKADGDLTIENCWSASQIESNSTYVGGIVGYANAQNTTISHCLNSGNLTYTGAADSYFGGIVGSSHSSSATTFSTAIVISITDCLNVGTVSGTTNETFMGGVIGNAGGATSEGSVTVVLTNAYTVDSKAVVGNDYGASITSCGAVAADNLVGDLAKANTELDFTKYWTVRTDGTPVLTTFANK